MATAGLALIKSPPPFELYKFGPSAIVFRQLQYVGVNIAEPLKRKSIGNGQNAHAVQQHSHFPRPFSPVRQVRRWAGNFSRRLRLFIIKFTFAGLPVTTLRVGRFRASSCHRNLPEKNFHFAVVRTNDKRRSLRARGVNSYPASPHRVQTPCQRFQCDAGSSGEAVGRHPITLQVFSIRCFVESWCGAHNPCQFLRLQNRC